MLPRRGPIPISRLLSRIKSNSTKENVMSVEENKATLKRIYDEVWNKGNMSVVPELISPEYLYRTPQRDIKGPDGFSSMITIWRTAFPDLLYAIDEVVGEGGAPQEGFQSCRS